MLSHDQMFGSQSQPHLLRHHSKDYLGSLPTPKSSARSTPNRSPTRSSPPFFAIRPEDAEHIWVVTGPAGCGKTTVAKYLSWQLSLPYIEGDDYHSASNKAKMANGEGLSDADRWDWLITLREEAVKAVTPPDSTVSAHGKHNNNGVIVTCSALKYKYRDVIRIAAYHHPTIQIHFIYLQASESMLQARVAARQGHYMKSGMVHSQFQNLEEPDREDDVLSVDVDAAPEEVQRRALEMVKMKLKEYEPSSSDEEDHDEEDEDSSRA